MTTRNLPVQVSRQADEGFAVSVRLSNAEGAQPNSWLGVVVANYDV